MKTTGSQPLALTSPSVGGPRSSAEAARRKLRIEYWYSLFALALLAGAMMPLFTDLTGSHNESFTDSNPYKLVATLGTFVIALALLVRRFEATVRVLSNNLLIVLVFTLPIVSLLWSVDPGVTFRRSLAYFLTGAFCIYLRITFTPDALMRRLMIVLLVAGIFSFAYVFAFPAYGIHHDVVNPGAWKGVYGHKNALGRICSLSVLIAFFFAPKTRSDKYLRLGVIVVSLILLLFSQSRTNWLILLASSCIIPLLRFLRNGRVSLGIRLTIVIAAGAALFFMITVGGEMLLHALGRDTSFSGRTTLWRGVNTIVEDNYLAFGAGYGAFFTEAGAIYKLAPYLSYWSMIPDHAHSGYINTFADLGMLGVTVLTLFLASTIIFLIRKIVTEPKSNVWSAYLVIVFAVLINNFSETVAFRHSDIAWVLVCMAHLYASPTRKARTAVSAPGAAGRFNGSSREHVAS